MTPNDQPPQWSDWAAYLLNRPQWQDQAACRNTHLDFIAAENTRRQTDALQICGRCPVRTQCLQLALNNPDTVGIFGGTDTAARRAIRANQERNRNATA